MTEFGNDWSSTGDDLQEDTVECSSTVEVDQKPLNSDLPR